MIDKLWWPGRNSNLLDPFFREFRRRAKPGLLIIRVRRRRSKKSGSPPLLVGSIFAVATFSFFRSHLFFFQKNARGVTFENKSRILFSVSIFSLHATNQPPKKHTLALLLLSLSPLSLPCVSLRPFSLSSHPHAQLRVYMCV